VTSWKKNSVGKEYLELLERKEGKKS